MSNLELIVAYIDNYTIGRLILGCYTCTTFSCLKSRNVSPFFSFFVVNILHLNAGIELTINGNVRLVVILVGWVGLCSVKETIHNT